MSTQLRKSYRFQDLIEISVNHDKIKHFLEGDVFIISNHARIRMFQRNISTENIKEIIIRGQIIEDYPEEEPCPSTLFFSYLKGRPCHIVVAECTDISE